MGLLEKKLKALEDAIDEWKKRCADLENELDASQKVVAGFIVYGLHLLTILTNICPISEAGFAGFQLCHSSHY